MLAVTFLSTPEDGNLCALRDGGGLPKLGQSRLVDSEPLIHILPECVDRLPNRLGRRRSLVGPIACHVHGSIRKL